MRTYRILKADSIEGLEKVVQMIVSSYDELIGGPFVIRERTLIYNEPTWVEVYCQAYWEGHPSD